MQTPSLKNLRNFGKIPKTQDPELQKLGAPHVSSFNYMTDKGLDQIVANLIPVQFELPSGEKFILNIENLMLHYPRVPSGTIGVTTKQIYPAECRESATTYKGKLTARVSVSINGRILTFEHDMGDIPIMIKSNRCHLETMSPKELIAHSEHEDEWGGYFVVKGHHRLIRMLQMTRRNYPIAIRRRGWKAKDKLFSEFGVKIRSVREDQTSRDNTLHFVNDGTAKLAIIIQKNTYYIPVMLVIKVLGELTDHYIYEMLLHGYEDNSYFKDCILNMLRAPHEQNLHSNRDCRVFFGKVFRERCIQLHLCPKWYTDIQIADFIIKNYILVHLEDFEEKADLLIFMIQKLFVLAKDECKVEGVDAIMMQELLLGGHLYMQLIKERLEGWLYNFQLNIAKRATTFSESNLMKCAKSSGALENVMEKFLATGNLLSNTGLGLMQESGLTIVAENINMTRYMAHFRSIHRGSFFVEMRTTEARQLLPDAWGFVCPVHTPDGSPCGLLNHLTLNCVVTQLPNEDLMKNLPLHLDAMGMLPLATVRHLSNLDLKTYYIVLLDGKVVGYVPHKTANRLVNVLRSMKIKGVEVPQTLEIALVPRKTVPGQFPGLYLFTSPARMMRPVFNDYEKAIELIGTFEQVYMDIAVTSDEIYAGITRHVEVSKTAMLSNLAQLIPWPDCNQSPRNMYQCQMSKQTMGTPLHTWATFAETKSYRLQTPATPLVRPRHYDDIKLDNFAMGTNAVIAVISYTGYDMEDALIINKASYERGFGHGSIFKSEYIELDHPESYFCRDPENELLEQHLDTDGLPFVGKWLKETVPFYSYYNADESKYVIGKFKGQEDCLVHSVRLCGSTKFKAKKKACIVYRIPRNPTIGDKFASRAGQKGICSRLFPAEDMPFTETGMVPDIIFNPHSFPSRMTIAMMIELMAGKSAATHGWVHDATPFIFNEKDRAIDYFGRMLEVGGFNYYGTEIMYSGVEGTEMNAAIFFGIVHYQRLRHMVSDKWQVRSTGTMDALIRQPIGGRKKGGGVRFGEMERDSLLSHGSAFLLQDRLFHNSDKTKTLICTSCKTLVGPFNMITAAGATPYFTERKDVCRLCESSNNIETIEIPYVFKYFVIQLASVNINVQIDCSHF